MRGGVQRKTKNHLLSQKHIDNRKLNLITDSKLAKTDQDHYMVVSARLIKTVTTQSDSRKLRLVTVTTQSYVHTNKAKEQK